MSPPSAPPPRPPSTPPKKNHPLPFPPEQKKGVAWPWLGVSAWCACLHTGGCFSLSLSLSPSSVLAWRSVPWKQRAVLKVRGEGAGVGRGRTAGTQTPQRQQQQQQQRTLTQCVPNNNTTSAALSRIFCPQQSLLPRAHTHTHATPTSLLHFFSSPSPILSCAPCF